MGWGSTEVPDPQVDVVVFCGERMDAEVGAPLRAGLEVAAVGSGGVRGRADQPAGGQPEERAVSCRAGQPVQRLSPDRRHGQAEGHLKGVSVHRWLVEPGRRVP